MDMCVSRVAGLVWLLSAAGLLGQTVFLIPGQEPVSKLPAGTKPFDCRPFGAVAFHVKNAASSTAVLQIQAKDAAGAITKGTLKLRPEADFAVAFPLNSPDPLEMGMRGPAAIPGYRLTSSDYRKVDLSRVSSIAVRLPAASRVSISEVKLVPGITYDKIVDPLGQFALGEWPGKV